jgi:peptidoglycan/xylan/chitin deacetylase (PgdA/CDA1 family)
MHHGVSGCALTFDDGPDPLWTPLVLDCLRRENVRATFFVIADRARRNGDLIERMRNEGHEVAFHCVRHIRHSELNESAVHRDADEGLRTLRHLRVHAARWRAPWGVVTPATTHVATLLGLAVVGWNLDTEDWRGDSAVDMHARVLDGIRTDAVVLKHDGLGPGARRSGCEQTVQLIPRLTETMRARRLLPLPLSELSR